MPYLMEETEKALNKKLVARTLLDGMIIAATYSGHQITFTVFMYAAIIRNMVASKFGIEITDPEPAPPTAPPTQEEPSSSADQQADQKDLPKVFGDEKQEGGVVASDEVKEIQPSPAEAKEGKGESDPSTAETSKTEEGATETDKTDTVKEEQTEDDKPEKSEDAEPSPVDSKVEESKDSMPVEKEGGDEEQPATESKDSEEAGESKATTDDTPEAAAVAAVTEEPSTQSEETADKQEETIVSDENKTDGEPSTGETVHDEPTKTVEEEPADPPTAEEQS